MYCCQPCSIAQHGTGALEHPAAGRFAAPCAARRSVGRLLDTPALGATQGKGVMGAGERGGRGADVIPEGLSEE